jgi:RNA polymerase sigma-70 factor (ECF subfamily)
MSEPDSCGGGVAVSALGSGAEGFAAFYREFEEPVLRFFMGATRGRADLAADLTAETFACALESREVFDPRLGRPDQWLFGIARNVLGKSYRRGRVDASARERLGLPRLLLDDESLAAIERLCEERSDAMLALASLPEEQRRAITARVVEEREYGEIAGELRCSEAVVRQRVSRGLRTLRKMLGGER